MAEFDKYLRAVLDQAGVEAQSDGSATVEARHVLLAMTTVLDAPTEQLLQSVGLDHAAVRAALDREYEQGLSAAGVSIEAASRLQQAPGLTNPAGHLGESVRHALERGLHGVRTAPRPAHLLLGVLQAEVGTVSRALALAGVDRAALIARVRETLTQAPGVR